MTYAGLLTRLVRRTGVAAALAALVLASCATTSPVPVEQFAVAKAAIADAVSAGAPEFAPGPLRSAQDDLDRANAAMNNRAYADARRFAEAAEVDARLAASTARSRKAQRAVAEVESGIRALREEVARTGVR
jgi:hypothetical protein